MQKQKNYEINITNPNKLIYKTKNIRKIDVINYYRIVSVRMLPLIKNRLLSVIRCHDGVEEACFIKKHPTTEIDSVFVEKYLLENDIYFYIKNIKNIIYQAQMGTIEFHIWGSKITNLNFPDMMIFDLDPDEKLPLNKLREGVKDLKNILDNLNLKSFLKTSGGKGYHIVIPFTKCCGWEKFNTFSKQIALLMEQKWPQKYTTNIRKNKRKGKIFIDYMRNTKGSTCVAPYSLRAKTKASVSMPIFWHEIDNITPNQIGMSEAIKRISKEDPWSDFFKVKQKIYDK